MIEPSDTQEPGLGSIFDAAHFDPQEAVVADVTSYRSTTVFVVCLEPSHEPSKHPAPAELTLVVVQGEPIVTMLDRFHSRVREAWSSSPPASNTPYELVPNELSSWGFSTSDHELCGPTCFLLDRHRGC